MGTAPLELLIEARRAVSSGSGVELRRAAGLSQGELARAAGINPATLSRWESRERKPSGPAAIRYAHVLRMLRSGLASETREAVAMGAGP
jgi:DNA-binding transcriptional regulator YiaG